VPADDRRAVQWSVSTAWLFHRFCQGWTLPILAEQVSVYKQLLLSTLLFSTLASGAAAAGRVHATEGTTRVDFTVVI
jgi:hypothetical protein